MERVPTGKVRKWKENQLENKKMEKEPAGKVINLKGTELERIRTVKVQK
jgi:hypothetical protein